MVDVVVVSGGAVVVGVVVVVVVVVVVGGSTMTSISQSSTATLPTLEASEAPLAYTARTWKPCCPLARLPMLNERASGRWVLWTVQPPPGALEASTSDSRSAVVPTLHWIVTDEQDGTVERLTAPNVVAQVPDEDEVRV